MYNSSPLRAHTYFPPMFYLSTRGTTTWAVFHLELSGRHQSHLACAIGETKPLVRSICGLDCERRSRETRETRAAAREVSRLQSRAWSFACLGGFARRTKKKERLLVVYLRANAKIIDRSDPQLCVPSRFEYAS